MMSLSAAKCRTGVKPAVPLYRFFEPIVFLGSVQGVACNLRRMLALAPAAGGGFEPENDFGRPKRYKIPRQISVII
ncbi:hypothetical protein BJX99DRAFT_216772, partial [Aspergillus californicus]